MSRWPAWIEWVRRLGGPPAYVPPPTADFLGSATLPHVVIPPVPRDPLARLDGILRETGWSEPIVWALAFREPMRRAEINTKQRIAAFLGTCHHETAGGRALVESFNYDATGLARTFGSRATPEAQSLCRAVGKPADQRALACLLYGGEWGRKHLGNVLPDDGWRFRGRGAIQLTGRANYERVAAELNTTPDALVAKMNAPAGAAEVAARWWDVQNINRIADRGDALAIRRAVNGGLVGLADFQRRYRDLLEVMG